MANNIKIEIIGADKTISALKGATETLARELPKQIIKSALKVETEAKRKAPSDTGRLRGSIQTRILQSGFKAEVFSDVKYAPYVEKGTRPHFPPPNALQGWARRHNMEGLELVIARKIGYRGTKAQPFLFPAWEKERPKFIKEIKNILKGLG